jgi:HAE1 family hydrophobic/amphiphilic exporter-1
VVRIRAADDKPRLDLAAAAGWKWLDAGPIAADGKTWSAGLYFSFPFFDGLATRGRVAQAESDLTIAELDYAQARLGVAVEVRSAIDDVRVAAEIARGLGGTVDQARRLFQMAEQGQELGVKTRLDVDDALLNLRQAEGSFARARRDYLVARSRLLYAQGLL